MARNIPMTLPAWSMTEPLPFEKKRREMIDVQLRRRGLRNERVLEAMFYVPRHEFVPPAYLEASYDDRPLPIGQTETISQPYIVAAMTQAARVEPGEKALEVGTGSGYQAAILAYLGAKVYTVERNPELAELARERLKRLGFNEIKVTCGDGSEGLPAAAPFPIILVTAAAPDVPSALLEQLANGGRLVIPVGNLVHQDLLLIFKHGQQIARRVLDPCQFVPLIGKGGWPEKTGWVY
jgi:protein-L-isoaspartate(D-aspartate) O-methyltransferase